MVQLSLKQAFPGMVSVKLWNPEGEVDAKVGIAGNREESLRWDEASINQLWNFRKLPGLWELPFPHCEM